MTLKQYLFQQDVNRRNSACILTFISLIDNIFQNGEGINIIYSSLNNVQHPIQKRLRLSLILCLVKQM